MKTAAMIATIVVACLALVGGIVSIVRAVWTFVNGVLLRLKSLEDGSAYKDRRLDSLESMMRKLTANMGELLARGERRQHPRGA